MPPNIPTTPEEFERSETDPRRYPGLANDMRASNAEASGQQRAELATNPANYQNRNAYESEMARTWAEDRQRRDDANTAQENQYVANPFMSNRAPGYEEQAGRLAGMEATLINPEAMEVARQGALGNRPSQAEEMLRGVYGRGMASARAQAATGRGNAYLAQRGATTAMGDMTGRIASEAGALRADEMAKYADMYLKYSGMDANSQNIIKVEQGKMFNELLANGWSYDEALRRVANQQTKIIADYNARVFEDRTNRANESTDPAEEWTYNMMGGGAPPPGPPDPSIGDKISENTSDFADWSAEKAAKVKAWLEENNPFKGGPLYDEGPKGGMTSSPDMTVYADPTATGQYDPGFAQQNQIEEKEDDSLGHTDWNQTGRDTISLPGQSLSTDGLGDMEYKGVTLSKLLASYNDKGVDEADLDAADAELENSRDVLKYLSMAQRYGNVAESMASGGTRARAAGTKDLASMVAKDATSEGIKALVERESISRMAGKVMAPGASLAIDAARIGSARMSPREKKEAMGKSAVQTGVGAVGTSLAAPVMGPLAPVAGGIAGGIAGSVYDYILA